MLRFLKGFFGKPTPPDVTPKPEPVAPYKVEAPVLIPQLSVVKTEPEAKLTVDGHGDVQEVKPEAKPKKAPAKKAAPKKPAAIKASAKPKAPRKPKAK